MKNYLLAFALLAPGLSQAQAPAPTATAYPYLIKGRIAQLNAPAKVYLVQGTERLDSVTLHLGQFELKGAAASPSEAALVLERQGRLQDGWRDKMFGGKMHRMFAESPDRIRLFLEPGPVVVTSSDSMRTAHLAGGPLTADYQQLQAATKPASDKMRFSKSQADFDANSKEYAKAQLAFARTHPSSWVSLLALEQMRMAGPPQYAEVAPVYAALTPAQRATPSGRQYGEMLAGLKVTAIGEQAPAFTQLTPAGKQVSLADYRGKYVLVDFWASWCTPCRAENPYVLKAYNAFKARNFEVLGVSLDEERTRDKWVQAIADDHMPWTQVSGLEGFEGGVAKRYGIQSIPQNFLVDPSGKIVAANLRGDELMATLAKFIR